MSTDQESAAPAGEVASRDNNGLPLKPVSDILVGNLGPPITIAGANFDGVAAEPARSGDMIKLWVKLTITSDNPLFHRVAEGLFGCIGNLVAGAGKSLNIERTKIFLMVIKPDRTAEIWADTAAVAMAIRANRAVEAGKPIFEHDIIDLVGMSFPLVTFGKEDKVICLIRQDWRFGLYFDFNPDKNFSIEDFQRELGNLYRGLKYRHIYDTIEDPGTFDRLVKAGWFPFSEIITREFRDLARHCEAGFDLTEIEGKVVAAFDDARLDRMLTRWLARPHLASREVVLRSAIKNFSAKDPVAVCKTVLTEIEGVLNEAYYAVHGKRASVDKLIEFVAGSAEQKAGAPYTLLLPQPFKEYLKNCTFASFRPGQGHGKANMRHAVGHGEASPQSYTQVAALQAILTLDQLAFST